LSSKSPLRMTRDVSSTDGPTVLEPDRPTCTRFSA
jgi:hypothetical protein